MVRLASVDEARARIEGQERVGEPSAGVGCSREQARVFIWFPWRTSHLGDP
jgi:hypothetical protein